jgi:mannose-6-phosphate isomerase-like protein (cupin superfamily)
MSNHPKSKNRLEGYVKKGWGYEYIFITNELYCLKALHFTKAGNKFSMHFHREKDESWYVESGSFILRLLNTDTGLSEERLLETETSIRIRPFTIHQLVALEDDSRILEVSTADSVEDNYRVAPGDSQSV